MATPLCMSFLDFYVFMSWGPTGGQQTEYKHSMLCQVNAIEFLRGKQSLRKTPHAFGSELTKK